MIERRKFLAILAATVAASRAHGWPRSALAAQMQGMSSALPSSAERAYVFFTDPEVAFIKAAVARLIPTDELRAFSVKRAWFSPAPAIVPPSASIRASIARHTWATAAVRGSRRRTVRGLQRRQARKPFCSAASGKE